VAEWFKAPVLKTGKAREGLREFESHPFRQFPLPRRAPIERGVAIARKTLAIFFPIDGNFRARQSKRALQATLHRRSCIPVTATI
jgi:hypothetical protein